MSNEDFEEKIRGQAREEGVDPKLAEMAIVVMRHERERCAAICEKAAARWPDNHHVRACLLSVAEEIRGGAR